MEPEPASPTHTQTDAQTDTAARTFVTVPVPLSLSLLCGLADRLNLFSRRLSITNTQSHIGLVCSSH
ncbi:hypothetical protein E2C01_031555 [Portunus trituberculatus]|uniref:Uncharacterized protein n=1 Tax=Portunus trituberculatus TaxID=210409 RepID=A0A5B7F0E0_PORTR|nr:hypothetical protein [Portunus trituberculatus]